MILYFLHAIRRYYLSRCRGISIRSRRASLKAHYGRMVLVAEDCFVGSSVSIGDYSYINPRSSLENCEIGKFCSISSEVCIGPHEHLVHGLSTHPFWYEERYGFKVRARVGEARFTKIGNDVWIGFRVVIRQGITISDGAIVGAGSVVTKDIPPFEIWAGVPARKIGERFPKEMARRIQQSKWWDRSPQKIQQVIPIFFDFQDWLLTESEQG